MNRRTIFRYSMGMVLAGFFILLTASKATFANEITFITAGEEEVAGTIGTEMILSATIKYSGSTPVHHFTYQWWDENENLLQQDKGNNTTDSFPFTPRLRETWIKLKISAFDSSFKPITLNNAFDKDGSYLETLNNSVIVWKFIKCDTGARILNPENHIRIAKNGSTVISVKTSGTKGKLSYVWSWIDRSRTMDWVEVKEAKSSSCTVRNYSNPKQEYLCEVFDDLGIVDRAIFYFQFCYNHTGKWTVTKSAGETLQGEEVRVCTQCGYVERRTIPASPLPVTIEKRPSLGKQKAGKKGKVTFSWKKFRKTKKTKKTWNLIKNVEVQYSTDLQFLTGVSDVMLGRGKTKLKVSGLNLNTVYYVRARYRDGSGGCSVWSSVKQIRTKKK